MSVHQDVETADTTIYDEEGRTRFPDKVREYMGVGKGDELKFVMLDGDVYVVPK